MHPDMLLLTERLVVAVERMSEDVKNISVHINDVSYCVQQFFNEKRKIIGDSKSPSDEGDNQQLSSSAAMPETTDVREGPWQYEQTEGRSVTHNDSTEHAEISVQAFASVCMEDSDALPTLPVKIKTEVQSEGDEGDGSLELPVLIKTEVQSEGEDDGSFDQCDTGDGKSNTRAIAEVVKEENEFWSPMREESDANLPITDQENRVSMKRTVITPGAESSVAKTRKLEEGPLKCTICNKEFSKKSNLVFHRKLHANMKPFKCSVCTKSFNRRDTLDKHMRMHSGERPYTCRECGKAFRQSAHLTGHMRSHAREKPFRCTMCGEMFTDNSALTRHVVDHLGEQLFGCEDCGSSFIDWEAFQSHRLSEHGGSSADPSAGV